MNLKNTLCTVLLEVGNSGTAGIGWRQVNRLGVEGNYVCYLVIVVLFMGLGGEKM